jgi:hypothetical protein
MTKDERALAYAVAQLSAVYDPQGPWAMEQSLIEQWIAEREQHRDYLRKCIGRWITDEGQYRCYLSVDPDVFIQVFYDPHNRAWWVSRLGYGTVHVVGTKGRKAAQRAGYLVALMEGWCDV